MVGELRKPLRRKVAFAAFGSIELATVHAELKWHKSEVDSLDEALKVRGRRPPIENT